MPSRRPRQAHARNPSNPMPTSDYDTEALAPPASSIPPRTNTELNLGVLRRYLPSITAILSVAANAVVYTFDLTLQTWEKSGVEGTLFVCALESPPASPRFCVFVLNRRGLENLVLALEAVREVEVTDELLILALGGGEGKALGLWMHADGEGGRALNMEIIRGLWEQVRDARRQAESVGAEAYGAGEESVGPAVEAIGKTLSIDDLFASQAGGAFGR